jgi:hypothetical protein
MPKRFEQSLVLRLVVNSSREIVRLDYLIRSYYPQIIRFVNAVCRLFARNLAQNDVFKMSSDQLVAQLIAPVQGGDDFRCRVGIMA